MRQRRNPKKTKKMQQVNFIRLCEIVYQKTFCRTDNPKNDMIPTKDLASFNLSKLASDIALLNDQADPVFILQWLRAIQDFHISVSNIINNVTSRNVQKEGWMFCNLEIIRKLAAIPNPSTKYIEMDDVFQISSFELIKFAVSICFNYLIFNTESLLQSSQFRVSDFVAHIVSIMNLMDKNNSAHHESSGIILRCGLRILQLYQRNNPDCDASVNSVVDKLALLCVQVTKNQWRTYNSETELYIGLPESNKSFPTWTFQRAFSHLHFILLAYNIEIKNPQQSHLLPKWWITVLKDFLVRDLDCDHEPHAILLFLEQLSTGMDITRESWKRLLLSTDIHHDMWEQIMDLVEQKLKKICVYKKTKGYWTSFVISCSNLLFTILCGWEEKDMISNDFLQVQKARMYTWQQLWDGYMCTFCEKILEEPLKCSRCHRARYCDRNCQKQDWSLHKQWCKSSQ